MPLEYRRLLFDEHITLAGYTDIFFMSYMGRSTSKPNNTVVSVSLIRDTRFDRIMNPQTDTLSSITVVV